MHRAVKHALIVIARLRAHWRTDADFRRASDITRYPLCHSREERRWARNQLQQRRRKPS